MKHFPIFAKNLGEPANLSESSKLSQFRLIQGMHWEFGSAGAVCSIEESCGPQNLRVSIVLKASKFGGHSHPRGTGNALARVQRVHEPADLWDITLCTRRF